MLSKRRWNFSRVKSVVTFRRVAIALLQLALIVTLVRAGWLIYKRLPASTADATSDRGTTTLQIVLTQTPEHAGDALDVTVRLFPVDIVAVRHEFFTEPRAGKRFEDFLKERMKGRSPVDARLDKQGHGAVLLTPGSWWLHATLPGEEQLEWRLPVRVDGTKQVIELTPQNAYTRSRTF